ENVRGTFFEEKKKRKDFYFFKKSKVGRSEEHNCLGEREMFE
mgnify:CR=1